MKTPNTQNQKLTKDDLDKALIDVKKLEAIVCDGDKNISDDAKKLIKVGCVGTKLTIPKLLSMWRV